MAMLDDLIRTLDLKEAASEAEIRRFEETSVVRLPDDYLEFLRRGNGAEGFLGDNSYVILWGLQELLELNEAYEVKEYAPGLLLFGSDGGGEAYAFDTRDPAMRIVRIPFVPMDLEEVVELAPSFVTFLERMSQK